MPAKAAVVPLLNLVTLLTPGTLDVVEDKPVNPAEPPGEYRLR